MGMVATLQSTGQEPSGAQAIPAIRSRCVLL